MQPLDTIRWRILAVLHFFIGITAILGGGALVVWPSGTMLQLPLTLLAQSPFHDFLLPGFLLYGAVGVHNLIACFVVAKRESGAELISFSAGCALLLFLVCQMAMVGPLWFQALYGALALIVVLDAVWIRRSTRALPQVISARS